MLVILDRDGVINEDRVDYIKSPDEWVAIPGSLPAIAKLNQANITVVVATNQSGIGRNYYTQATLDLIHQKMQQQLAQVGAHVDAIYYCPHHPDDNCSCRKPKPGLLQRIATDFNIDLSQHAILIGDSLRDIQAAQAVNCPAIIVKTGNGNKTIQDRSSIQDIPIFDNLAQAIEPIIQQHQTTR